MNDHKKERLKRICAFLPESLSDLLMSMDDERISRLCEIRIRACKPVVLCFTDAQFFVSESGRLTSFFGAGLLSFTPKETENIFVSLCRCSVHSLTDSIAQGFITADGGCRVGIYGTAVTDGDKITSVRNIRGLNIRLSGDFRNIAVPLIRLFEGRRQNVLICGPPSSGKTTMLKDLCRILSDEKNLKICIVDERGETSGSDTGVNTDVLDGYPKAAGILIALRTLSPDIIAFDEIGSAEESEAVCSGLNCGVNFIMTIHCRSKSELAKRPQFRLLMKNRAVDSCVFLGGTGKIQKVISAEEIENETDGFDHSGDCLRNDRTVYSFFDEPSRCSAGENTAYDFTDGKSTQLPIHTFGNADRSSV